MKFKVNDDCIGCNLCALTCPKVFFITEQEKAQAIDGEVLDQYETDAVTAMQQCPVAAIEQID